MFRKHAIIIAAVVISFFVLTSGGQFAVAYGAADGVGKSEGGAPAEMTGDAEERFAKLTEDLTSELNDPTTDTQVKRQRLGTHKGELASLDADIRKQFAETEKKLKDAKLPVEILDRHKAFVKHYEENLAELKGNMARVEKAKDAPGIEAEIERTRLHLEKVKAPARPRTPGSQKLPQRSEKPDRVEPRLKKEDFEEKLKDKNAWKHEKPIMVASMGSLAGLLSSTMAAVNVPTPDDLAETIDVQFTPEIKAKAQELGSDPLRIYEWVRNTIEYVPTYGSIQGADQCLRSKQCNDIDTASLLIALLRSSGIHARYAYGTIEVPIDRAMSWVGGMTDPLATADLLSSGGVPVKTVYAGGAIKKLQLEHAWVEAWLDYIPSRGARHAAGQGDTWIPLDASFKLHSATGGLDLAAAAPFDTQTFINQLTGSATVSEAENYATNVQCAAVSQYQQGFRTGVQNFLATEHPGATIGEVLGTTTLVEESFPFLLGTLPYQTIVKGGVYGELPASLRHSVTFQLVNNDTQSANYSETSFSLTLGLPKLAGKRVTLSYSPATASDEAVIASYSPRPHADGTPISLSEYPASLPAYLIQVKGELRVDGVVVATGIGAQLGGYEQFGIQAFSPNISSGGQELYIKAGEYVGIAFGTGPVTPEQLLGTQAALGETTARLKSGNTAGLTKDEILGGYLHASALASLAESDALTGVRAKGMGIATARRPSSSAVTLMLSTTYFFGIPRYMNIAGPSNAEMGYRMAISARDGNRDKAKRYLFLSGLDASSSASALQEYLLSAPGYPVTSVSAAKAMKTASERAVPVYRITPANSGAVIGKLQLAEEVEQNITNEAGQGLSLIVPQRNVTVGAWTGVGYEAHGFSSGSNYTNLNGPPNVVQGMPGLGRSLLLSLLPSNAAPPATLSSAIVTDSFVTNIGGLASGLSGLSSGPATESLDLLTSSILYDRLGDKLGCYLDLASPAVSTGSCMATYLSLLCTATGTPIIADKNSRPIADAGTDRVAGIGETVTLDASRSYDADKEPLVYQWRFAALPEGSGATLAGATTAAPWFTADVAGVYTVELIVGDGKKSSAPSTVTVTAYPSTVTTPSLVGLATEEAKNAIRNAGLSVGAITAAPDDTMATGSVTSQSPTAGSGADRGSSVQLVVSTGPQADSAPPLVSIGLDRTPALYAAGTPVRITAGATDVVGISDIAITVDGTAVTPGQTVTAIDTTGYQPGSSHTVQVTARDISLNSASATATFGILDPADTTPPTIAITSPAADAAITAPVDIIGSVVDTNLFEYTLAYTPAGKAAYTIFARGAQGTSGGVLGRLDPTLMQNGIYDIVLTAVDANGNTTSYALQYRITGDLKVGNFTVSFTDLNVPVSGIPVSVTRSYDSRDKQSRDFGFGWSIDIQSIKIEENSSPGEGWNLTSSGGDWPTYCVGSEGERYVSITLPDGRVEEFDMTVTPKCQALVPIQYPSIGYTPRTGTTSTLKAKNVGQVYVSPSGVLFDLDNLGPYNPSQYLLTTADGAVYELDETFGVRKVTDPNGNSLTYGTSGVIHSSGRSLSFSRDAKGRITQITDPAGKTISYGYDLSGNLATVTDQGGNITRYTYNSSHGLIDITDPLGRRAVRNEYDTSGRIVAHIDADGKRIEYNHDIAGRQEVVKDRNGNLTVYVYDDKGRVLQKTDPLGKTVTYTYDAVGNKLSETDPLGNKTSWTYDSRKNVLSETRVIDGKNITTSHTYNGLGKPLTTTDPKGNVTTNTYDAKGNLLTSKDPLGNITTNSYDAGGNLLTTTDPLGNVTSYEYDGFGNRTRQAGPGGAVTTYTYDTRGNKLGETDAKGNTTTYGYDNTGKLLKTTDPLGNVTSYEYDKAGNKIAETNPLGLVTTYLYDTANRVMETRYPDGTTTKTGYDAEGNRTTATDRAGRVTGYSYNANKRLVKTTYADGTTTENGYDAVGRQVSTTDAAGKVSTREYDALGRVIRTTDPENHGVTFEFDANGNQTKQTDANGHATTYEYDANNRLIKTILPGGQSTTTTYDAGGRKLAETDAAGNTTTFAYDKNGNLQGVTDALGQVTGYEYDANNNRTAIVDANGHRTTFTFDKLNRMLTKTMPNGGVESYTYDAAGRQTAKTDAKGQTITLAYDAANRLVTRTYPDESNVTFTYTQSGKRATATDQRGATSYTYDNRDRLTATITPDGQSIGYSYDSTGRISSISGPAGTITHAYSAGGRLATVTDPQGKTTSYSYDQSGNRTGLSYPNGTSVSYGYDVNSRLTSLGHSAAASQVASYAYTLGAIGNRTRIDEGNGISRVYTYDNLYRLTREQVTDPSSAQTYTNDFTYDAVGNRQNKTLAAEAKPVVSTDYSYNAADQLVSESGVTYTYDLNGSLASRTDNSGTTSYAYDYDGHMVKVVSPTGTITYAYDVDGNRVESAGPEGTTRFLVDTNRSLSQVLAEYRPDNTLIASYTYADDLISMTRGGQTYWYHFDGLGSTRALSDGTGAVTDTYDYDAFGNLIARTGTTENPFLFTGQRFDANTGFYHLRARYYQPGVGRFTAVDPWEGDIFAPATLHRYLYTANDPVNMVDLSGENFSLAETATTMAIGGVINTITTFMFNQNASASDLWGSFAVGAVTAPVGGFLVKAFAPMVRATLQPLFRMIGNMDKISLVGRSGMEKLVVKFSRFFVNTNKQYPRVSSTAIGKVLQMAFPNIEWEMHHVFIQQAWSRAGSAQQIYSNLAANAGLKRIGNGLWNLLPIPRELNNWLGRSPIATQMFATAYYSIITFGSFHAVESILEDDE